MSYMPLKPSRRLPRAYQRKSSGLSRKIARKHTRRRHRGVQFHLTKLNRHWRRFSRHARVPFKSVRLWCIGITSLVLLILVPYFLFSPAFVISSMRVSRQDRRTDVEEIQELLKPYFGKHILFVSPLQLTRTIQSEYSEVSSAKVRRNFPNELSITLYMDPIVAEVIIGEPDDTESNYKVDSEEEQEELSEMPYAYLTEQGVFLEYPFPFPGKAGEERVKLHLVDWAVKPTHRQILLTPEALHEIINVKRILSQSFGHTIPSITLYLRAREFHVQTEETVLWFDLATPIVQQINRYRSFLSAISLDKVQEYIDLRLYDRVVYR